MRVAVVGAGVLGTSTAVHLARAGAAVTLLTEGRLAEGASGRSLAWLNSFGTSSDEYHRLRALGLQRYRDLSPPGSGPVAHVRFDGAVKWASDEQADDLRAAYDRMQRQGHPSEWLAADQISRRCPGVNPAAVPASGAVMTPTEGWADLPSLIEQLTAELVDRGGTISTHLGPVRVRVADEGVRGAAFAGGGVNADAVVLATGPGVPAALEQVGVRLPDATSNALLLRTGPVDSALRHVLNTPRASLRPATDGGLAVDSGWSEAEVTRGTDGTFGVREETISRLLHEASAVLAGQPALTLASVGVGRKPIPGDGHPVLGSLAEVPGYYVAFTHSGATLALIAGELLAQEIVSGVPVDLLEPFRPSRFRTS